MHDPDLTAAIRDAMREAVEAVRAAHPDEAFYGHALYTTSDASYIVPTALGREGLAAKIRSSADSPFGPASAFDLRWSPCDSPYHLVGEKAFEASVAPLLEATPDLYELSDAALEHEVGTRYASMIDALRKLDAENLFGTGAAREGVLVTILCGDQSDEERYELACAVGNPASTLARFRSELVLDA